MVQLVKTQDSESWNLGSNPSKTICMFITSVIIKLKKILKIDWDFHHNLMLSKVTQVVKGLGSGPSGEILMGSNPIPCTCKITQVVKGLA